MSANNNAPKTVLHDGSIVSDHVDLYEGIVRKGERDKAYFSNNNNLWRVLGENILYFSKFSLKGLTSCGLI
jgi:hypothetical protein